ncbi:MAG: type II secretion system minor pseudopilin GspJ [Gammaproteobacteria bacterium]|nr:type II secretion system minor pseudopilin GspJ [Gammaproteobacteria bacterium]
MTALRHRGGFTLVEVLVALAVFAVVGLMSAQLMSRTLANHEILGERSKRLAEVQRAMLILKRDLMQVSSRSVRDLFGDPLPPVMIGADGMMEFSRAGWRNPLNSPRAEMQRVAYRIHEDHLHRAWWPVLDRAQDSEPVVQRLLSDVEQVEFLALDANGDEHAFWPNGAGGASLVAIIMRLECEPFGVVERIWPIAGTLGAWMQGPTEGAEQGERSGDDEEGSEGEAA